VKRGSHDLSGTTAKSGIACLRLDQFGVGKNDTQLIVEAMEQKTEVGRRGFHGVHAKTLLSA